MFTTGLLMIVPEFGSSLQSINTDNKHRTLKQINRWLLSSVILLFCLFTIPAFGAKVSLETRKELGLLKKELSQVARQIKQRDYIEARSLLKEVNTKLDKVIESSRLEDNNRLVKSLRKTIKRRESEILKKDSEGGPVFDSDSKMSKKLFPDSDDEKDQVNASGKVSFTRDIAPFMVNLCLRCHNNKKSESDFSLQTFESLMKGGENGTSITPGNLDKSYLWSLVGKQDPVKMPQGQARITKKNWNDLKTWITEGAKFDGVSIKTNLRDLVPSKQELDAKKMRSLSDAELQKMRLDQTRSAWKRFNPDQKPNELITEELILLGNVEKSRLEQYAKHLQEGISLTRKILKIKGGSLFRGRLAVFILKDRFSFDEYHFIIDKNEIPKKINASLKLTKSHEEARIVFYDSQQSDSQQPGRGGSGSEAAFPLWVTSRVMETYLSEENTGLPYWIRKGTGLAALSLQKPYRKHLKQLRNRSLSILRNKYPQPLQLFEVSTFLESEMNPVSLTLVQFFIQFQGEKKFLMLVKEIYSGSSQTEAMKKVYGQSPARLGQMFYQSLK